MAMAPQKKKSHQNPQTHTVNKIMAREMFGFLNPGTPATLQ